MKIIWITESIYKYKQEQSFLNNLTEVQVGSHQDNLQNIFSYYWSTAHLNYEILYCN